MQRLRGACARHLVLLGAIALGEFVYRLLDGFHPFGGVALHGFLLDNARRGRGDFLLDAQHLGRQLLGNRLAQCDLVLRTLFFALQLRHEAGQLLRPRLGLPQRVSQSLCRDFALVLHLHRALMLCLQLVQCAVQPIDFSR